ncbi:hypothetical protein LR48_Vigan01g050400 [Vigna angularis]|uniref:Uncharacterized protein n=1 Tax=Phaseolus angularis TaxID=3914 RepID=A0A0L9TLE5_PHAAN|nr:hypothetical protein LR48_Vigan01g050400 [Vigna angularis]
MLRQMGCRFYSKKPQKKPGLDRLVDFLESRVKLIEEEKGKKLIEEEKRKELLKFGLSILEEIEEKEIEEKEIEEKKKVEEKRKAERFSKKPKPGS